MAGVKEVETRCAAWSWTAGEQITTSSVSDLRCRETQSCCRLCWARSELEIKMIELNRKLTNTITLDELSLDGDNAIVKYYTGLSHFSALMALFSFVSVHIPVKKTALSNQSSHSLARYFAKWVDIMYIWLKPLIKWPSHEELLKTIPTEFRASFRKCVVIVDCFEIFYWKTIILASWPELKHGQII